MLAGILGQWFRLCGPREALADPLGQSRNRLGRKLFVIARHRINVVRFDVVDRLNKTTGFWFARNDDRAEFTPLEDEFPGIQPEA